LRARREWQRGQPSVESVMRVPPGVIDGVLGTGAEVGEAILRAPQMRRVTFTGAVRVGRAIGGNAADRIIPMTQELGGTSEDNVFEDADLPSAAVEALNGYCRNADQVGSAGWRIRVQRSTQADFVAAMAETMAAVVPGDTLGPLTPPRSSGSCRSMSRRPRPTAPGWWRGAPWRM
jgi:aldehyde dehydrogenase (NAD+)